MPGFRLAGGASPPKISRGADPLRGSRRFVRNRHEAAPYRKVAVAPIRSWRPTHRAVPDQPCPVPTAPRLNQPVIASASGRPAGWQDVVHTPRCPLVVSPLHASGSGGHLRRPKRRRRGDVGEARRTPGQQASVVAVERRHESDAGTSAWCPACRCPPRPRSGEGLGVGAPCGKTTSSKGSAPHRSGRCGSGDRFHVLKCADPEAAPVARLRSSKASEWDPERCRYAVRVGQANGWGGRQRATRGG